VNRVLWTLPGIVVLLLPGCATIPFQAPRESAWGYTAEDAKTPGASIYIYETRMACELGGRGACRELAFAPGGEFYWLISFVEWRTRYSGGPAWVGSVRKETCDAMRDYIRIRLSQPTSDCTRTQLLLK